MWGLVWYNMQLCLLDSVKVIGLHKPIMLEAVFLELCSVNYAVVVGSFGMTGHISVEI
jgi:hypothetical protein